MNYKSNKIFTKCCASILAVSNIFSGVSATPKKAEDNQLSISKKELGGSILGASGFATLATLLLSKMIFSANSTSANFNGSDEKVCRSFNPADTKEDIEAVESMALALAKTDEKSNTITREGLLQLCRVSSCSDLLNQEDISVTVNGAEYKYVMSSIENPSGTGTQKGKLSDKLNDCLYGFYDQSGSKKLDGLNDSGWNYKLPFVIHLTAYSSNKTKVCRKHTVVKLKNDADCQVIECLSPGGSITDINISQKGKSTLYPDDSSDKALIVVGYWKKQTS